MTPSFSVGDRVVCHEDLMTGTILRHVGEEFDGRWFVQWDDNNKEMWVSEDEISPIGQDPVLGLLNHGVHLFEKMVGVSSNKTYGKFSFSEYDLRRQLEDLSEARTLDPSGVTPLLLLRYYTESFVSGKSFSWMALLRQPELAQLLETPRKILSVIESKIVSEASDNFAEQMSKAMAFYNADHREDIKKILSENDTMAFLRRDALRAIQELRVDQFLDGDNDPEGTIPVYAKVVHQWWNINSMIEHLTRMPSGVSLNLIREPDGYSSYFAFAIRNGSRLFVLSDCPTNAHPLFMEMARRPDRDMSKRIARNWFPYDLMNIAYTEDGKRLYIDEASNCTEIAVRQSDVIPLKPLAEIEAESLIWVAMLFDLIVEKFWKKEYKAPQLSYTGEMIRQEATLLSVANKAGLPAPIYEGIGLSNITAEKIRSDDDDIKKGLGSCPVNVNQWMIDRYGDQCSETSLNLLGMPGDAFLLENNGDVSTVTGTELQKMNPFRKDEILRSKGQVRQLSATAFGTKESLDNDRIWLARHNWALQVQRAAEKEYEERRKEITDWYHERARANISDLMALAAHININRVVHKFKTFDSFEKVVVRSSNDENYWLASIMFTNSREDYDVDRKDHGGMYWWSGRSLTETKNDEPLCAVNHTRISYLVCFQPTCAEDIALFTGCQVQDLPDVLQHYREHVPYTGNHILQRIDPAVSKLSNPWLGLELGLRLGFSKRGYKTIFEKEKITLPEGLEPQC